RYLSPRSPYPTLAIPVQGIGNWCSPLMTANIDDSGLRKRAGTKNRICLPQGIPFATPGNAEGKNIIFTSRWDNYPPEATVPLSGRASHAYLLMAGSTNYMQSRFSNGEVIVDYADGTQDKLVLRNPETWWPIEQDYFIDGYAFPLVAPHPVRVHLKTGEMTTRLEKEQKIDGGAATVLDLSLDSSRELKDLKLVTLANEVVIGLMAVTLAK
ncbi:MAG: glycogen debranching protein, partial [Bacteroidota bacterium]|nr:glycogen debranching protein [Bacteroidota bacterium]